MKILWKNQIVERDTVKIDIEDRAYQYGDGLYEAIRIYHSEMFMFDEHFDRLARCAKEIRLELPFSRNELKENLEKLIALEKITEGEAYLQVSRGIKSPRNHLIPLPGTVEAILTANVIPIKRDIESQEKGHTACIVEDQRWLHCNIKSLSLLGNVLSLNEAVEQGYDDALLVRNGFFTEASASNLWFVIDGKLYTHEDGNLVLPGITKMKLREIARELDIQIIEKAVPVTKLDQIEECFASNSIHEVTPIVSINEIPVKDGKRGPITKLLLEKYIEATI
ncbi:D-amino-acid transaminase [Liquorilactobacillus cacaonum]|uniref:D-alanine aminotransferase n=1 Tax=Liquorilactobacillus cacaonum DSM 21116 TaxID=1423729 RepID=A0A0R2CR51_9LACO|nr:D-amino-acid transaminase [Liquorilactobacillus cacaonum]KRM90668.1 D-amino acid aminotransferase [Liquorilactobacillus cacaonum DSM 21116]